MGFGPDFFVGKPVSPVLRKILNKKTFVLLILYRKMDRMLIHRIDPIIRERRVDVY
jgi:hypothetical protein